MKRFVTVLPFLAASGEFNAIGVGFQEGMLSRLGHSLKTCIPKWTQPINAIW